MASAPVVFTHAKLFDGEKASSARASVVIEGNRIAHAGSGARARARRAIARSTSRGKTVMPGLVQGHFHSGFGPSPTLGAAPILGLEAPAPTWA